MPLLAVPAALAVILAIMCVLVIYGGQAIGKLVSYVVPNWHIIGLGNLRTTVEDGINVAVAYASDALDHLIAPAVTWTLGWVSRFVGLYDKILSAVATVRGVATWIVTTYIPREVSALGRAITAARVAAEAYAATKVAGLAKIVAADLTKAERYALAKVDSLAATVAHDVTSLEAYARTEVAGLAKTVAADLTKSEAYAKALLAGVVSTAAADLAKAEAYAAAQTAGLAKVVVQDVTALGGQIIAAEQTAVSTALGVIATDIDNVTAPAIEALDGAVAGALGVAGTDFPDITSWLKGIPLDGITSIAGVTALSLSVTGALAKALEDCVMPNCRNLSGLGRDLQALLGLVEDASFLGLIVALITDPEGAARDIESGLGGLATDTIDGAKSLLGVG